MALCVDASAIIPFLLPLPSSPEVSHFWADTLRSATRMVAPPLLFAEVTAVSRRYVHLGSVPHDDAALALRRFFQLPITTIHEPEVYLRALELARRLGQARAYDVQYLAVAEIESCPIVTLDRGLYENARTLGIAARLIA